MKSLMTLRENIGDSKIARGIKNIYQVFLFISGAVIVLAMVATVLMRYVFKTDLFGMEEIILTVVVWFYFFGGVNGSMEDSQISADIISTLVKNKKVKWVFKIIARIVEIIAIVFFIILSFQLLAVNFKRMPTTQGLKIPYVVPQMAIFIGFTLMLPYTIGHFIVDLWSRSGSEPPENITESGTVKGGVQ
jgi:TRAP-type C4-dicarboxylate transport system permease small subunit